MTDMPSTALPEHLLARPDMRDAIARHDFGEVFALAGVSHQFGAVEEAEAGEVLGERAGDDGHGRKPFVVGQHNAAVGHRGVAESRWSR